MLTTARMLVEHGTARLSALTLLLAVFGLTVAIGLLPALFVMMGECSTSGSSGC